MFGGIHLKLQKATRVTLTEQIAAQLDQLIQSGEWAVGQRIPAEPELVEQLGVSRNTVREAVKALIHAGLLEARQGDGTYVCSKSDLGAALNRRFKKSDLMEILEVRYALEREAVRLAAERRTEEDIEYLQQCLMNHKDAGGKPEYVEVDLELHKAIVQATHNSILIDLYEHMTETVKATIHPASELQHQHDEIHADLVKYIVEQNVDAAVDTVHRLIQLSMSDIQMHLM
jgi:DNA-binding FadR family transcriptional regulator